MGVISVRVASLPLQFVNELRSQSGRAHPCAREVEKLTLIKRSLMELYEDSVDREEIDSFEKIDEAGNVTFLTAAELADTFGDPPERK